MIPALSLASSLFGTSAVAQALPAAQQTAAAAAGSDFGQVFAQVGEAINTLKTGESAAISGLQGQTSVQHVVESVMSAERSLQTAIAIRDKIVSAYQTISQMAI
ncbi:flagellar hook-basal body complex protein FliE [Methylocapsa sp. D3K7]|uniref:flagellar hook-basal body complex protein FliE n=1 Tax=Methylocapsa sp. D3K7 TaxID=3041435 RepID=UPI00244EF5BF|nr:flagellar hook-basal body complex protein FliE [Methylocapsa sp. D3K7]WGJ14474.1 flagellar hook-basal body complex protein FliE [Methylocapsa sp. D3K7]